MVVIVVATSVMVFVYATGLFSALTRPPNLQKEALSLEFSSFGPNNPTYNVTLYLRNTGSAPITLVSYYVKDPNGNQYAKINMTQTTISPTALTQPPIQILISACSCTNTGGAFMFSTGNSYTITLLEPAYLLIELNQAARRRLFRVKREDLHSFLISFK